MNNVLKRWLVLPALIVPSSLCAQDEKSLAYFAIRLDTTSLTYLNMAKSLLDELKKSKETLAPGFARQQCRIRYRCP